jgi:hypothetical protein
VLKDISNVEGRRPKAWTERSCLLGLFLILPLAAFWPCLRLPFIQDDWGFLLELQTNNTAVLLANFFHPGGAIFYRPLAATYLLALYKLFGVQPWPFHVLALAIHIFNASLVFRIMTHLLRDRGIGLLTGLLYAVAVSIHLDPLCWAVGIYDIGGACFFFLAIWFFIREHPKTSVACFLAGVREHLPQASLTFDKFHVVKLLNGAVDEVRREEQRTEPGLKSTRYLWLKNPGLLTAAQGAKLAGFSKRKYKTARSYRMKLVFQEIYRLALPEAELAMEGWNRWATRSRLEPIIEFARMLRRHWEGVMMWFYTRQTNALLEGLNSLVQTAKARARGYRSFRNFRIMICLIAGHMGLLPT